MGSLVRGLLLLVAMLPILAVAIAIDGLFVLLQSLTVGVAWVGSGVAAVASEAVERISVATAWMESEDEE